MKGLTRQFERLTRWLHHLSGALLLGLMVLTVANIVGRWLFDAPVAGTVELTEIGMVGIVFLGLAYAQVREDHIRVDLLYERLGPRGRKVLGLFAALVSFATVAVLTWRLWSYAGRLSASGRTTSALRIPLSWVAWVAVAGAAIYAMGVVVTAHRRARDPDDAATRGAGGRSVKSSGDDVAGTAQPARHDGTSHGGAAGDAI